MLAEKKSRDHIECALSDLDLFTPAFEQSDIESGDYEDVYPITKLEDNGPIEFVLKNGTDKFIDIVNSYLKLSAKITKPDGTDLDDTDKASFINYPIASLFSQVDFYLGDVLITSSSNTYAFRAILETILNYGEDAKKSQLTMGLFSKDTAGNIDETDPAKDNAGLKDRFEFTKNSALVELSGRLHSDICNQGRLLLNGLPLKIVLHRSKDNFSLIADGATPASFKVKITDAVMRVRKVKLTVRKFAEIQQRLEKTPIVYPINRVVVKTHSIAAGLTSLNWDNAILGQLPNRIFIAMVDNDSYTGTYKKNPFNFKHFDVRDIAVYVNGKTLAPPMKLDFESGQYLEGYRSLFCSTGKINRDEGLFLTRKEFSQGYSLFGFDLSPSLCNGAHQEPIKEGNVRVALQFSKALPNTITVLIYADFDNSIQINKARGVIKDY